MNDIFTARGNTSTNYIIVVALIAFISIIAFYQYKSRVKKGADFVEGSLSSIDKTVSGEEVTGKGEGETPIIEGISLYIPLLIGGLALFIMILTLSLSFSSRSKEKKKKKKTF